MVTDKVLWEIRLPLLNSAGETGSATGLSSRASNCITQPLDTLLFDGGVFLLETLGPSPDQSSPKKVPLTF